ncbi:hypothetical protein ACFQI3_10225 [Hansschlegelia quercus]|uniref:Uncharacterized protein n=1 Tax=Hansschlegelia quercus TaxID=2528245 RepID=A0A4Q9GJF6_9HYPH|nr:hypothetical protein [Hansschlegelia quercus]TBN54439.1 hypothetical protein EYR15_06300 [Hansschlegelia quercus]
MYAAALLILIAQSSEGARHDDAAVLQQLGFIAGQAVACDIEEPDIAARVAIALADKMGRDDEASRELVVETALRAAAMPCAAPPDRLDEIRTGWSVMRRRAGVN